MTEQDRKIPWPPGYDTPAPSPPQQTPGQIPLPTPEDEMRLQREIEDLKRKIGRFFSVYEVRVGLDAVAFHCRVNEVTLEENFELLRGLLKPDYIPVLTYEGGEHILYVTRKPKVKYRGTRVNLILLIITIITTTIAGSSLWVSYDTIRAGQTTADIDVLASLFSPYNLFFGAVFFSLPLLLILGTHETSHYLMAKKHGVAASLPFFIPMIPPLGTLGAVISMREPIPNKKALMDIGAAGPIGGLLVAIPVTIIGLVLTNSYGVSATSSEPGGLLLYNPILLMGLSSAFPIESDLLAHPTFFAGWVGILVTALNLLPAGQLDGGHIVRALFGEKTRYIGMATVILMIFMGFVFNYFGYVLLIVIVMVLGGGLSHPPPLNDVTKLDRRRVMVGVLALIIFAVSFHPAPFQTAPLPDYGFELSAELHETAISPGGYVEFNVSFRNIGSEENEVLLNATMNQTEIDEGWNVILFYSDEEETKIYNITDEDDVLFLVGENETKTVTATIYAPASASFGDNVTVNVSLKWNSWKRNQLDEVVKRIKRTSEEILVKVE
ncbi:MAG: site-2 protease family protein [Thermoplasmata archaeon]|nr:MAG: site-2 protease family protein [Thermoplasmata archaeon]